MSDTVQPPVEPSGSKGYAPWFSATLANENLCVTFERGPELIGCDGRRVLFVADAELDAALVEAWVKVMGGGG